MERSVMKDLLSVIASFVTNHKTSGSHKQILRPANAVLRMTILFFMRIYVKVLPRSSRNSVEKTAEGEYKVKLTAPPVDGEANTLLIKILAEYFNVVKSAVVIMGGKSAKTKIVDINQ